MYYKSVKKGIFMEENKRKTIKERYTELKNEGKLGENLSIIDKAIKIGIEEQFFGTVFFEEYVDEINEETAKEIIEIQEKIGEVEKEIREFEENKNEQRKERGWANCDAENICYWFMTMITPMLKHFRENIRSCPDKFGILNSTNSINLDDNNKTENMKKWEKIIDRMIFLSQEMNSETCSKKNKYEEEVEEAYRIFEKENGFFGEKLQTKEEQLEKGLQRIYFPTDDPNHPEWIELFEKYNENEKEIEIYRDKCKEEFFQFFGFYFWNLWD